MVPIQYHTGVVPGLEGGHQMSGEAGREVAKTLFEWWCDPSPSADILAPSFCHDAGLPHPHNFERDDYVWFVRQAPRWTNVKLMELFGTEDRGAVAFEGTDPVTGLRHRVAWVVHVQDGKCIRLIDATATISDSNS